VVEKATFFYEEQMDQSISLLDNIFFRTMLWMNEFGHITLMMISQPKVLIRLSLILRSMTMIFI